VSAVRFGLTYPGSCHCSARSAADGSAQQRSGCGCCRAAYEAFTSDGYIAIGMDHFALPATACSGRQAQGRLHRNFQGYTTEVSLILLCDRRPAINAS